MVPYGVRRQTVITIEENSVDGITMFMKVVRSDSLDFKHNETPVPLWPDGTRIEPTCAGSFYEASDGEIYVLMGVTPYTSCDSEYSHGFYVRIERIP